YDLSASMEPLHPTSTLFPYTTLFRSRRNEIEPVAARLPQEVIPERVQSECPKQIDGITLMAKSVRLARMQRSVWKKNKIAGTHRSEEHTSELQSRENLVCRLLLEKKK